jgi:hypothetical protein
MHRQKWHISCVVIQLLFITTYAVPQASPSKDSIAPKVGWAPNFSDPIDTLAGRSLGIECSHEYQYFL